MKEAAVTAGRIVLMGVLFSVGVVGIGLWRSKWGVVVMVGYCAAVAGVVWWWGL